MREGAQRQLAAGPAQQRTERGDCEERAGPAARCDAGWDKATTAEHPTPAAFEPGARPNHRTLPVDADVVDLALVLGDELLALHEHAAAAATGVEHAALVRFQHGHQQFHHAARGVELAALLALRQRELAQEVLEHMAQHIGAAALGVAQGDVADEVDEAAEAGGVQVLPGVHLGQHALQRVVLPLDGIHGLIHRFTDAGLLGVALQKAPPRAGRHEEDVLGLVLVLVLGVGAFGFLGLQPVVQLHEGIADVLEENEAEHDVLVLGSIDVLAQLVSGFPELLFDGFFGGFLLLGHAA